MALGSGLLRIYDGRGLDNVVHSLQAGIDIPVAAWASTGAQNFEINSFIYNFAVANARINVFGQECCNG